MILSTKEINKVRHKAEKPLYALCVLITVVIVIFAVITVGTGDDDYIKVLIFGGFESAEESAGEGGEEEEDSLLFWIALGPFLLLGLLYYTYALSRADSIRVTEKNFPEIYHKSVEFAKKLGLKKVPAVYIEQHHGILNAFAAAVIGKNYAMLNAEIVDIAYMEHKDFDTVFFVLAHEFGHIYLKHATFSYLLMVFIPHLIPVFGQMHSRSQEYSCDRIAQILMERDCAHEAMILSAGRHLYKYVDVEDYLATVKKEKGIFLWFVNLMATHPIMKKRIAALADPYKKSGKLF